MQLQPNNPTPASSPDRVTRVSGLVPKAGQSGATRPFDALQTTPAPIDEWKAPRLSIWQKVKLLMSSEFEKPTGLENLSTPTFLELCQLKKAFVFATETNLARGYWSSLLAPRFLEAPESRFLKEYLKPILSRGMVIELGARDHAHRHAKVFRSLGSPEYVGIDRQAITEQHGGLRADALAYLSRLPDNSVAAICAFGVFNHPLSLSHDMPGDRSGFGLPASDPQSARRGHCEHEYARRLAFEIERVLMPEGLLFGAGFFNGDIGRYLRDRGLIPDSEPDAHMGPMHQHEFDITQPFFFRKLTMEQHMVTDRG